MSRRFDVTVNYDRLCTLHYLPLAIIIMDSGERITISTVHEWRQIKENVRAAMSKCFEASVAGSRATKKEQEAARKALDSVRGLWFCDASRSMRLQYVEGMITALKANVRVNGQEMDTVNEEDLGACLMPARATAFSTRRCRFDIPRLFRRDEPSHLGMPYPSNLLFAAILT